MGIVNGPAPEGRVTGGDLLEVRRKLQAVILERDALQVQLQESEQLRQDAFRACEIHRQEYEKLRLERDEWKAAVEYQQQQATELQAQLEQKRAQVEQLRQAAEINYTVADSNCKTAEGWEQRVKELQEQLRDLASERDSLKVRLQKSKRLRQEAFASCEQMRQQVADKQRQSQVLMKERDDRTEQLQSAIQQLTELQAQLEAAKNEASKTGWVYVGSHLPNREQLDAEIVRLTNNWGREIDERKALQQQVADLQAQLEAAAVTPSQQPDGTAERLEAVRRMIGHVLGWYTCTDWFDEVERAEAWEQVGALLGHLQREAG